MFRLTLGFAHLFGQSFGRRGEQGLTVFSFLLAFHLALFPLAHAEAEGENNRPSFDLSKRLERQTVKVVFHPMHELTVSVEVEGKVLALPHKLGDAVKKNSLLAQLESERYRLAYEKSLKELELLEMKRNAVSELYEYGDESQINLDEIKSQILIKESEKDYAKLQLNYATITSPINGRIAEVLVNEYEYVERGKPILKVIDKTKLKGLALLPANMLDRIAVGETINVYVMGSKERIEGRVLHIAPYIDPTSSTVRIEIEVENPNLMPGMVGYLLFTSVHTDRASKSEISDAPKPRD